MATIPTREEPDGLIISIDKPSVLNDFRSSTFRDTLYQIVQSRPEPRIALDLSAVDYLSSSGVAILVGLKRRVDPQKGKLVLFGIQPIVHDLLRVMRLEQYFTFAETEDEALALLRPARTA